MLLLLSTAFAVWPDDVTLSALSHVGDTPVHDPVEAGNYEVYETVVRELAVGVANKPIYPAETLGINGFEVGLTSTLAFTSGGKDSVDDISTWDRVHVNNESQNNTWIPGIMVRKGLPLSLEVGANYGWLSYSRQSVLGGFIRAAPLEGYRQAPDIAFQLGYAGYIGNDELELGVMDWSGTISYTMPFGTLVGIHHATFAPYLGAGQLILHAEPRMSADEQQALGIKPVSGFKGSEVWDAEEGAAFRPATVHTGIRIVNRGVHIRLGAVWAPSVMPTLNGGLGFSF